VILEEMTMYEDSPEDDIQDKFDDQIFPGNSLANNILGTKESVSRFNQSDFHQFLNSHISTSKLVISTVSNWPEKKALKIVEKYIAKIPEIKNEFLRVKPTLPSKRMEIIKKPINQTHCMMGRTAYSQHHENRLAFFMLANLLGGPAMNTRLNIAIREKYGLVYTIDAQYSPYHDTGLFSIYFGAEKKNLKKATDLILNELKKLREISLTDSQLKAAKNQLKGQLAISEENNNGMMMLLARSILDLGYVESLDNIFSRIDAVTSEKLKEIAIEMLQEEDMCYLIYEPVK